MPTSLVSPVTVAPIVSLALCWVAVRVLRVLMPHWGFVDVPNERSSHRRPTPRAGGLAFATISPIGALVAWHWMGVPISGEWLALLVGAWLVAATGLLDDRLGLPVLVRFGVYSVAAVVFVVGGGYLTELQWPGLPPLSLGWLGPFVTLIWLVGLTNAYNFMDGIDGIAGAQAVVAAGTVGLLASLAGDGQLAILTASLAGGVLGFVLHNWPPARIFMGDVGSAFLGYCFAGLAVLSGRSGGSFPFAIWLILLAPFLFDTGLTLVVRVIRGEPWYRPHRQHLYQRLIRRGWSHLAVTSVYLGADLFLAGVAAAHSILFVDGVLLALLTSAPLAAIFGLVWSVERWAAIAGFRSQDHLSA